MPQSPRNTPANSGPGRGTPRSRTTARPGARAHRPKVEQLEPEDVGEAMSSKPQPAPRAQRAMTATWRLVVLLVVIAGMGLILAHSLRVYFAQAEELSQIRAQIATEKEQIADLEDKLERWNDAEYVRSIARVRLGWVMPGEVGYRVIGADGQPLEGATIGAAEAEEDPGPWWSKMWGSVKVADAPEPEPTPSKSPEPQKTITLAPAPSPSPTP